MFLELIATIFAGVAMAGVLLLVVKASGGRLPRWIAPAGAGLAMIGVTIASEYSWYSRTAEALPDQIEIVQQVENRALWRPWTYVAPLVTRFAAYDTASVLTNPELPGYLWAETYLFGRWSATIQVPVMADCTGQRRAALEPGTVPDAVDHLDWVPVGADDPLLIALCRA